MSASTLSGITGYVEVNTHEEQFKSWRLAKKNKLVSRRNFPSEGHPRLAKGVYDQTLTLSGFWAGPDSGSELSEGEEYTFHLGTATGKELVVIARVENMELANDVEDGPTWDVTAQASDDVTIGVD